MAARGLPRNMHWRVLKMAAVHIDRAAAVDITHLQVVVKHVMSMADITHLQVVVKHVLDTHVRRCQDVSKHLRTPVDL